MALCALPEGIIAELEAAGFPVFCGLAIRTAEGVVHLVECSPTIAEWCRAEASRARGDRDRAQALLFTADLIEQLEAADRGALLEPGRDVGRRMAAAVATASASRGGRAISRI
jgi:hypothetical protein